MSLDFTDRPPPLEAVIFDWDYTLARRAEWCRPFFTVGDHPATRLLRQSKTAATGWLYDGATLQPAMPDRPQDHMSLRLERALRDSFPAEPEPGAASLLRALLDRGVKVAVFSSGNETLVRQELEQLYPMDIAQHIHVKGRRVGEATKPDRHAITSLLGVLDVKDKAGVVMVGDRFRSDVLCAVEAGITPILYGDRPYEAGQLALYAMNEEKELMHVPGMQSLESRLMQRVPQQERGI